MKNFSIPRPIECITLSLLCLSVITACDSGGSGAQLPSSQTTEEGTFDVEAIDPLASPGALDNLHLQEVVPFEAEPSLGFALPPHGRIHAKTNAVGLSNGTAFELTCENGTVLVGINGQYSSRIEQVQPVCASVNNDGRWVGGPMAGLETAGTGTGQPFTRNCPVDHVVTGMASDFTNTFPTYLQVQCRKLDNANSSSGQRIELDPVGNLNGKPTQPQCASRAVATGIYGNSQSAIERMGLVCFENPAHAGRWSSLIDWPHITVHTVMLSDGRVLTYGTGGSGPNREMEYDVWDPELGISQQSHTNILGSNEVNSFCGSAALMPGSGDVLLPGGDASTIGRNNSGIHDSMLYSPIDDTVSHAQDMEFERWYPSTTLLPDGDLLIVAGRDINNNTTTTPEVYDTATGNWRSLPNASTAAYDYFYPRQFLVPDGRVFGISGRHMFYIDAGGDGTLTDVGDLPQYAFGTTGTAAMYEPGKIVYVGGWVEDGYGSAHIDVTSGAPVVTNLGQLNESRRAWASSVLLADGKVMVLGGSYITNDAGTASLGTEFWDPITGEWSTYSRSELPRLYHSTGLLMKDGRVLLSGGGSPGPLHNTNAEIFSPPYLFDESGAAAERPVIVESPDVATWGQTIAVRTSDSGAVNRVTLVRPGSVTHGFDMDQRFLELSFTSDADSLLINMPATANLAPPGYYMLFVHQADTPSEAHIISLGDTPAPPLPAPEPEPVSPPVSADSLLFNGGFENGKQGWTDCAASSLTAIASQSVEGSNSMKVSAGGCLFQVVPVFPGSTYGLSCEAKATEFEYASMSLQMLNAGFTEIEARGIPVETQQFGNVATSLEAPTGSTQASITLYSEGTAFFDRCELVIESGGTPLAPATPDVPDSMNLLSNGGFEQGKTAWLDCASPSLSAVSTDSSNGVNSMQVENAGCLYQEFPITPGKNYELTCVAKSEASAYSSLSFTLMNQNYTTLASDHKPVGRDFFQVYQSRLFTPVEGAIGAVTLYSEDSANFDECSIVEL